MNPRTALVLALLLGTPVAGVCGDGIESPEAPKATPAKPGASSNNGLFSRDALHPENSRPRVVLRLKDLMGAESPSPTQPQALKPTRPPYSMRSAVAFDCSVFVCSEFDSSGRTLRPVEKDLYLTGFGNSFAHGIDGPLRCQSSNDLLPVTQRFEHCDTILRQLGRRQQRPATGSKR